MGRQAVETRTGETLDTRYRLDRYVGDDGAADVYEGTDTRADSAVVVRVLRPEFALQRQVFEGFVALPKALLGVAPPHMARVFAVTSDDTGIPFVVEESSQGQTLADLLAARADGLPLADACRLVAPLIEAFARLHLAGVVHGQLEPGRVMLLTAGGVMAPRIVHYRTADSGTGTPTDYRAPEHRDGSAASDPAVDVWALGAVMHHMFTGRVPPADVHALDQSLAALPKNIASALRDALSHNPNERAPDAAVLWMRLEGALAQVAKAEPKVEAKVTPATDSTLVIPRSAPAAKVEAKATPATDSTLVIPREAPPAPIVAAARVDPAEDQPPVSVPARPLTKDAQRAMARALAPLEAEEGSIGSTADPAATRPQRKPPPRGAAPATPPQATSADTAASAKPQPGDRTAPPQSPKPVRPAGSLSDAQIKGLLALNSDREHPAWTWIRIVLLLLLLLLLYKVVPLAAEPDFVTARRVFGLRVKVVGIALMTTLVVAMARTWAVSGKANSLLMRPVVVSFQVVVVCVCVLIGGGLAYGQFDANAVSAAGGQPPGGAVWRSVSGMARTVLPYGVALLLLSAAAFGLMSGLRWMRQSLAVAIATLLLAAGGAAGGTHLTFTNVKAALARAKEEAEGKRDADPDRLNLDRIKQVLSPRKVDVGKMPEPANDGTAPEVKQRTSIGDGDDEKLMLEDMERQRGHQQQVIRAAGKELPTPPPER